MIATNAGINDDVEDDLDLPENELRIFADATGTLPTVQNLSNSTSNSHVAGSSGQTLETGLYLVTYEVPLC